MEKNILMVFMKESDKFRVLSIVVIVEWCCDFIVGKWWIICKSDDLFSDYRKVKVSFLKSSVALSLYMEALEMSCEALELGCEDTWSTTKDSTCGVIVLKFIILSVFN